MTVKGRVYEGSTRAHAAELVMENCRGDRYFIIDTSSSDKGTGNLIAHPNTILKYRYTYYFVDYFIKDQVQINRNVNRYIHNIERFYLLTKLR